MLHEVETVFLFSSVCTLSYKDFEHKFKLTHDFVGSETKIVSLIGSAYSGWHKLPV